MKTTRFVPTETELLDYYKMTGHPLETYRMWLYAQLVDVLKFAFDFDMNLVPLTPYSKAPIKDYPHSALTYEEAFSHLCGWDNKDRTYYGNFGIRGAGQDNGPDFVLLDYDQKVLTPALEKLLTKTLSIMTPSGWTFLTREPIDISLWAEMEKIPGFAPSEATLKARVNTKETDLTKLPPEMFDDDERNFFGMSKYILGNARRNFSYVCLAGAITCVHQSKGIGLDKPTNLATGKPVRYHWGFGHTGPAELCNGVPDGQKHWSFSTEERDGELVNVKQHSLAPLPCSTCHHDYRIRLFYKPDGDYNTFVPRSATIVPFKYFAGQVLKNGT